MVSETRTFHSKISGVTYGNRQKVIQEHARPGLSIIPVPEPTNKHDPNAVAAGIQIPQGVIQIGYLNAHLAEDVNSWIVSNTPFSITIASVTGGAGLSYGVNIEVTVGAGAAQPTPAQPEYTPEQIAQGKKTIQIIMIIGWLAVLIGFILIATHVITTLEGIVLIAIGFYIGIKFTGAYNKLQ